MVNDHLSIDEVIECERLVQEITAIVRGEKQNDQLSMQNVGRCVITLKYGRITVRVYSEKISFQAVVPDRKTIMKTGCSGPCCRKTA